MIELIAALERLLEKGVVVEPTAQSYFGPVGYRIRLATEDDKSADEQPAIPSESQQRRGW